MHSKSNQFPQNITNIELFHLENHSIVNFLPIKAHRPLHEQLLRMAKISLLNSLKIVTAKRPAPVSPIARRRSMLITKLNKQVAYARAQQDGSLYAPTRSRKVTDQESGERKSVEMPKRVKP
ncbi:hypothetical protein [Janthinobacterium sp. LB2P70]|uniref:hypothetical protein n=1 Tax=Janthinobacterium sp. LB2P70 TaxID=3424197 RepID=UPI003F2203F3